MTAWGDEGIVDPNFRSHGMYLLKRDKQKKSKQHWREKYGLAMPDASKAVSKVPTVNDGHTHKKIQMRALYQNNTTVTIYQGKLDKKATHSTNRSFRPGQMIIKDRKVKMLRTGKVKNVEKKTLKKKGWLLVDGKIVMESRRGRDWVFWDKYAKEDELEVLADKGITAEVLKMEEIEAKLNMLPFGQGMMVEVRQADGSKKTGCVVHIHVDDNWGKFNCQYEDGSYGALIDNANVVIDRAWSSQNNWDFMMDGADAQRLQREYEAKIINLYQKKTVDPAVKKMMDAEDKARSLIVIEECDDDDDDNIEYGTMRVRKHLARLREQFMDDAEDTTAEIKEKEKKIEFTAGDYNEFNLVKKGAYVHRGAKPNVPKASKYEWVPASCKVPPKCRDGNDCKNPECLFRHPDGREKIVRKMLEAEQKRIMDKINDPFGLKKRAKETKKLLHQKEERASTGVDAAAGARYLQLLKQAAGRKAIMPANQKKKKVLNPTQLMNICWLFRTTGTCKFGVNCPWKHMIPPGMRPAPPHDLSWMQYDQKSHIW